MISNYITQITAMNIRPDGKPMYEETATTVGIDDEGAGQYITIKQDDQCVKIDTNEWPIIRRVIDKMVKTCTD